MTTPKLPSALTSAESNMVARAAASRAKRIARHLKAHPNDKTNHGSVPDYTRHAGKYSA